MAVQLARDLQYDIIMIMVVVMGGRKSCIIPYLVIVVSRNCRQINFNSCLIYKEAMNYFIRDT